MSDINDFIDFTEFPNNVVMVMSTLVPSLVGVDSDKVFRRPLRPEDPSMSVGVVAAQWTPIEYEIGESGPSINRYEFVLQSFVKHSDEILGLAAHALLSKRVRRVLDTNQTVRVALQQLNTTNDGVTERTLKFHTKSQQFLSNEIKQDFIFVAALEWYLETETIA